MRILPTLTAIGLVMAAPAFAPTAMIGTASAMQTAQNAAQLVQSLSGLSGAALTAAFRTIVQNNPTLAAQLVQAVAMQIASEGGNFTNDAAAVAAVAVSVAPDQAQAIAENVVIAAASTGQDSTAVTQELGNQVGQAVAAGTVTGGQQVVSDLTQGVANGAAATGQDILAIDQAIQSGFGEGASTPQEPDDGTTGDLGDQQQQQQQQQQPVVPTAPQTPTTPIAPPTIPDEPETDIEIDISEDQVAGSPT